MTAKNRDKYGQWRDITLGFRVPKAYKERVDMLADSNCMSRRNYILKCLENSEIFVRPNQRYYEILKGFLENVYEIMLKISMLSTENEKMYRAICKVEKALDERGMRKWR